MNRLSFVLSLFLVGGQIAAYADDTNSLDRLVQDASLVAHIRVTNIWHSDGANIRPIVSCAATCVLVES